MLKKLLIISLRVIPMTLAGMAAINTIFTFIGLPTNWMHYVGGTSILTLTFLYLASYVFKFCEYHRMFLHYVVVCNTINTIDYYYGLPVGNEQFILLHLLLMFITMVIVLILFLKKI